MRIIFEFPSIYLSCDVSGNSVSDPLAWNIGCACNGFLILVKVVRKLFFVELRSQSDF